MVVEDHELLAQSLGAALGADGLDVVRPDGLDEASVIDAATELRPQVVLLDLYLHERGPTALPLVASLRALDASVVMVTGETDRARLAECVEAGALGIVGKHEPFEHLVAAVTEVAALRSILTKAQRDELLAELRAQRAADRDRLEPFERLTRREGEVLGALVEGKSAEVIAEEAYVSMATVRSQIRAVLSKLGVSSQLAAVAKARSARWEP